MEIRTAVVTGANGFVGSAVCRQLSKQGVKIIAIVRNQNSNIDFIKDLSGLQIVYCELKDISRLSSVLAGIKIDVFFHFAWEGSAGTLRGSVEVQDNNVRFACDAMKVCSEMQCPRFVFAASIMEYEIEAVIRSDVTPGINTIYSSAKLSADFYLKALAGKYHIDYIRGVISNIYGPGETSPRLINASLRKMIKGEHCAFSTGDQMYDFIYITDAAEAFTAIAEKGINNRTYYIGSLNPKPLKEFLREMRDVVNPEIYIGLGEIPFNGITLTYKEFDVEAVKKDTGFEPKISFSDGIRETLSWIREKE